MASSTWIEKVIAKTWSAAADIAVCAALLCASATAQAPAPAPSKTVPRAIGFDRAIAEDRFKTNDVAVSFQPAGLAAAIGNVRVKSVVPGSGTLMPSGSTAVANLLELTPNGRIVPELAELTVAQAMQELAAANFGPAQYKIDPPGSAVNATVQQVAPAAGTIVDLSDVISVLVYPPKSFPVFLAVAIGAGIGLALGWIAHAFFASRALARERTGV